MNKKIFISTSFKHYKSNYELLNTIKSILAQNNLTSLLFVEKYKFQLNEEKRMMDKAFEEIRTCSMMIAEGSEKAVGIGIEVGYAKCLGIPIIYVVPDDKEYSTTLAGTSSYIIRYSNLDDLKNKLSKILNTINSQN